LNIISYTSANYLKFSQNVPNRYLLIVRNFCNDTFIIFLVIKKVQAAGKKSPPPPSRRQNGTTTSFKRRSLTSCAGWEVLQSLKIPKNKTLLIKKDSLTAWK